MDHARERSPGTLAVGPPAPPVNAASPRTTGQRTTGQRTTGRPTTGRVAHLTRGRLARLAARPLARQVMLLLGYLAAGVAVTWPRAAYLTGRLPDNIDQSSYVWGLWWVAHQISHLSNPWFTDHLAAPAGVALGFDTLMPLPGAIMTPVTLVFGPSVSFSLLAIVLPGLLCYAMYRAARLWLPSPAGAIAAGAFYGLATALAWQDWYHLNIAAGALFLPLALAASVRLTRQPRPARAVLLGLVLGASALVNQESTIMAAVIVTGVLLPWLARPPRLAKLRWAALAVAAGVLAAGPQIAAMAGQWLAGGATVAPGVLAQWDAAYGAPPASLFAPSPRLGTFGLHNVASAFVYADQREGMPTYGVMLSLLAIGGLVAGWRRCSARLLAVAWVLAAALALGPVLVAGQRQYVPFATIWHGVRMSRVLPYTWFVQIPGLAAFREADRFMLLGLVPAALLAGNAIGWLCGRALPRGWPGLRGWLWPVLAAALALAALEAGYAGNPSVGTIPTAMPALDRPIAADRSGSLVVDVPFGLRGGVAPYGARIPVRSLVLATADGHPRSDSYTSWVPAASIAAIRAHPFYRRLNAADWGQPSSAAQLRSAHADALRMRVGWALVWRPAPAILRYLRGTGFRYDYRADGVLVYRLSLLRRGVLTLTGRPYRRK